MTKKSRMQFRRKIGRSCTCMRVAAHAALSCSRRHISHDPSDRQLFGSREVLAAAALKFGGAAAHVYIESVWALLDAMHPKGDENGC